MAARPLVVPYLGAAPAIGDATFGPECALIGRVTLGEGAVLGRLVTLRGDGHDIDIGPNCRFLDRATVHIADSIYPTHIGAGVTVGRFALVHACTVGDGCVIGDGAVVMDNSTVGPGAVIAAGSLVPPGKQLDGGVIYSGNPARPVREIGADELETLRRALIEGTDSDLPPLTMDPFRPSQAPGPLYELAGASPDIDPGCFVAPTSVVAGDVRAAEDVSLWFACAYRADGARITVGPRSNVQDNSILLASAATGPIVIGADVTVGHNVRMGACVVEDEALIGMGSQLGDGVVVERGAIVGARALVLPGTVVKAGHIWAGRPAVEFRPVKPEEADFFRRGTEVYVGYARNYLKQTRAA